MPSLKKGFLPILLPLILLAILLSGAFFYLYKNPPQSTKKDNQANRVSDKDQVLFNYIPNFDDSENIDLPNGDARNVYEYKGHKIVVGLGQVLEFDEATGELVRMSDGKKLMRARSGALIGDYLYISHSNELSSERINFESFENDWSSIDKIDLKTGKVVATYFGEKMGKHLINLKLKYFNNFLWLSSWNGIMKIDPETMVVLSTYFESKTDIGEENSCPSTLYTIDDQLFAGNSCDPFNSVYYYNQQNDDWAISAIEDKDKQERALDTSYSARKLKIPVFERVSTNIVNGKRYLFSNDNIYTLRKNEFPQKNIKLLSKVFGSIFVDKSESYALAVGAGGGMLPEHPTISSEIYADLVDLKSGKVTDLIKGNPEYEKEDEKAVELMYSFIDPAFEETASSILVKDKKSGKIVATFDKATKQLQIQL